MGSKVEKHLSRLAMPKTWKVTRKTRKWITRPAPGAHSFKMGLPLNVMLRDLLSYGRTTKEIKRILQSEEVLVDGKRRKDHKFMIGIMDVLALPKIGAYYRILFDEKGKIMAHPIDKNEANLKPCKIVNKVMSKKKGLQLNLFDGKNILSEGNKSKVGDTIFITLPKQEIKASFALTKGAVIFLTAGKNIGKTGVVENIKERKIIYKRGKDIFETFKECVFVIGKDEEKLLIQIPEIK